MKLARALALTAAAVSFSLSGCGGGGAVSETRSTSVLRLDSGTDPPGFDALVFDNAQVAYFSALIHGYLFRADGEGRLVPDLATVVPSASNGGISRDGRTVTYHLRRGVRWHDGAPFDARDVVFSFTAAMNPNNNVPDRTGFDHVAAVRALDPYTVQVRLTRPFSPFVPSCFTMGANDPYPVLPAHLLAGKHDLNRDPYNAAPVGLGPYKLVSWQRGSRIVLEADPHYFRGAPAIPRIEIAIIPDTNTVATVWNAGGIDLVPARVQAGRTFLETIRKRRGARIVMQRHYEFDYVLLNLAHPPLDDLRVRRALVMGIDRARIMQELNGELWVPGETDRLPGQFAYDPAVVQPKYDPAAAAALLDAAGWRRGPDGVRRKNGRPLVLQYVATTESRTTGRFGLLVQQQLAAIGIGVDLKEFGYNLLYLPKAQGGIYASGRFDFSYFGWQPNEVSDHSYLFRCDTRPPGGDNFSELCDPAIDRAAREELDTTDPAREVAGDRAITRRLVDQSDVIFLGFNREGVAYRDDLEGVVPSVTGQHLWNAWAWRFRSK
jgi:peptide/nickel transport system substrate-binding protein